jgi:hypothetical protein
MHHILSFSLFESEGKTNLSWDSDYDSLESNPLWTELKNRGFVNEPTPIMAKNKSLLLKNPGSPWFYPEGVVLQKSGYIRDKGAKSGFVRNDLIVIDDMLTYLIERYDKDLKKMGEMLSSIEGSNLSPIHIKLISSGTKAKWYYDKSTGGVNVNGNIRIDINSKEDKETLYGIRFGRIKGQFSVLFRNQAFDNGEIGSLVYAPDYVGDTLLIHGGRLESLKDLGDVKEAISIKGENYYNKLSLEGISECKWLNMGEFFNIPYDTKHCLLVLENGCLANNWTVNGPVMGKDIHATRSDDNIARSIILTSPKLQEASLLKYFDENPMSIDLLDSTSERTKGIKNFIFSKLGYTDNDIAAIKRQKNRLL